MVYIGEEIAHTSGHNYISHAGFDYFSDGN